MNTASKNTDVKQTLARGSAKMPRKLAITAARLKRAGGGVTTPRTANNAPIATNKAKPRRKSKPARPPDQATEDPPEGGAQEMAGEPPGKQPPDRPLALIARYETAGESHRPRKYSARHQPCRDPHGDEQREAR